MDTLGRHIILDLWECNIEKLNDLTFLSDLFLSAAKKSGATVREVAFHEFAPIGISGVVIISESHLTIHTFPEHSYASVDIYTCSTMMDPYIAMDHIAIELESKSWEHQELKRGRTQSKLVRQ